jgi:hypothetical protein
LETTYAGATPSKPTISTSSRSATSIDAPRSTAFTGSGASALSSAMPVRASEPITVAGNTLPSAVESSTFSASVMR